MPRKWHTFEFYVDPKELGGSPSKLMAAEKMAAALNHIGIEPGQILTLPFPLEFAHGTEEARGGFRFYAVAWVTDEQAQKFSVILKA